MSVSAAKALVGRASGAKTPEEAIKLLIQAIEALITEVQRLQGK